MSITDDIKKIVEEAVWAPSGDNSQPWRFRVRGNVIDIFNIPEQDTTVYNFRQRGSLVAHGALIENIIIAASHFGYRALPALFPEPNREELVVSIHLEKTEPRSEPLLRAMRDRVSNRRPYEPTPLTSIEKEALLKTAHDLDCGEVRLVEDAERKKTVADAVSLNERILFENRALHKSFFENIVWTSTEEQRKKRGLYLRTLELPPSARAAFRLFRVWLVLQFLNLLGLSRQIAKTNAKLYASAGALGAIVMPDESPESFIRAGRLTGRVWLTATHLGLHMQVLAGLLYLAQRLHAGEAEMLQAEHRELIGRAHDSLSSAFEVLDGVITMIFRVGRGQPPSARSSRLPPEIIFDTYQ